MPSSGKNGRFRLVTWKLAGFALDRAQSLERGLAPVQPVLVLGKCDGRLGHPLVVLLKSRFARPVRGRGK